MLSSLLENMSLKDEDTILFVDVVPNRCIIWVELNVHIFLVLKDDNI